MASMMASTHYLQVFLTVVGYLTKMGRGTRGYLEGRVFVSRIVIGAKTLAAVSPSMYEGHLILQE